MLEADLNDADFPRVTAEQRRNFLASTDRRESRSGGQIGSAQPHERAAMGLAGRHSTPALAGVRERCESLSRPRRGAHRRGHDSPCSRRLTHQNCRPLLSESLLTALGGGALALLVAPYVSQLLLSFVSSQLSSRLDYRVFLFTFVVCVATGGLCGLIPAFQAGRIELFSLLRSLLFGVSTLDLVSFAGSAVLFALVALSPATCRRGAPRESIRCAR